MYSRQKLQTLFVVIAAPCLVAAQSNIDPDHEVAWCENVGWTNWRDANETSDGVSVRTTFLAGFVWAENVGWINVGDGSPENGVHYSNEDANDFGVNIDPESGDTFGLAWGENIGWINFDTAEALAEQRARFDSCEHRFLGYAWGENIGWINLNDDENFVGVGPCEFGDYDCDGDVDLDDFAHFLEKVAGPDVDANCPVFDSDDDGDVDWVDFAAFQLAFTK